MTTRKQLVISTEDINETAVVFEDKGEQFRFCARIFRYIGYREFFVHFLDKYSN